LPGQKTIRITANKDGWNFNWLRFIRADSIPLTRITVKPDTVTLNAGETKQFTATGYGQDSSVFMVKPVWSVSGTGNTISANGLFNATVAGNYIITAAENTVTDTARAVVNIVYTCSVNNQYEAESASNRATAPRLETCTDVGGGQDFTNLHVNDWFAYNTLNVPAAGQYIISFRVSATAPAKLWVGHTGYNFGSFDIPSTGGAWKTITDTITLPALSYTGIHVQSGTFKFNWFSISNCAPPADSSLARMAYSSVKTSVETGDAKSVRLYPNPTTDQLTLELQEPVYRLCTMLDMQGNVVKQWALSKGQTRVTQNIGALIPGTYILKLENEHKQITFKVIKY
jgi:hypothetical protein